MQRIDSVGKVVDMFGAGKHGFTDGDPIELVQPTVVSPEFMNAVQEELAGAVEGRGHTLDTSDVQQLFKLLSNQQLANWSEVDSGVTEPLNAITWRSGLSWKFFAVGNTGTLLVSTDGEVWKSLSSATTEHLRAVMGYAGVSPVVAVGDNGAIVAAADGSSWTARTSGTTKHLRGIAYGAGLWVAVGQDGTIRTSPDGNTWTARTSGTTEQLRAVCYGGGRFYAVGDNGLNLKSADGITWEAGPAVTGHSLLGVTYQPSVGYLLTSGAGSLFRVVFPGEGAAGTYALHANPPQALNAVWADASGRAVAVGAAAVDAHDKRIVVRYRVTTGGGGAHPIRGLDVTKAMRGVACSTGESCVWVAVGDDGKIVVSRRW